MRIEKRPHAGRSRAGLRDRQRRQGGREGAARHAKRLGHRGRPEGVGRAVSLSSQQTTTSSLTGSQTVDYTNAWTGGLGQGLAQGMDRIAAYYLKLADKILPVLEVDAGASVDLVISRGVLLAE